MTNGRPDGNAEIVDAAERLALLARENAQLREALSSRVVIEQAKGVLAERYRLDLGDAFELLRRTARSNRVRLHGIAARVTPGAPTPPEVEAQLTRPAVDDVPPSPRVAAG